MEARSSLQRIVIDLDEGEPVRDQQIPAKQAMGSLYQPSWSFDLDSSSCGRPSSGSQSRPMPNQPRCPIEDPCIKNSISSGPESEPTSGPSECLESVRQQKLHHSSLSFGYDNSFLQSSLNQSSRLRTSTNAKSVPNSNRIITPFPSNSSLVTHEEGCAEAPISLLDEPDAQLKSSPRNTSVALEKAAQAIEALAKEGRNTQSLKDAAGSNHSPHEVEKREPSSFESLSGRPNPDNTSVGDQGREASRQLDAPPYIQDTAAVTEVDNSSEDLSLADYMEEGQFRSWLAQRHGEETKNVDRKNTPESEIEQSKIKRNQAEPASSKKLESYTHHGIKINTKASAELHDGDFMRIIDLIEDNTGSVFVRGWLFRRTRVMNGLLERKINELCWIMHVDDDDSRDPAVQSMVSVPVAMVKRRRKIRMTNHPFPMFSFREDDSQDTQETVLNQRILVCRFKYVCYYTHAQDRERYMWSEKAIYRLRADECDLALAESDRQLRYDWRGDEKEESAVQSIEQSSGATSKAPNAPISVSPPQKPAQEWRQPPVSPGSGRGFEQERRRPQKRTDLVDLTDSGPLRNTTHTIPVSTSDAIHSSIMDILSRHQVAENSAETIDIDLRIDTTTKTGTLKRRYKGQVISSFIPNAPRLATHQLSESRLKRRRINRTPSRSPSQSGSEGIIVCSRTNSPASASPDLSRGIRKRSPQDDGKTVRRRAVQRPSRPKYTFGDCFCGGGGMSRGASMAGLDVRWGFDFNAHACKTYAMNFPRATTHNLWAHEFSSLKEDHRVDICHLSPPCQFFSDAHTVMGKDDDMNTASLFAIMELLKKIRPRVVTLEQTSGLLRRHELYFNAVIQIFTSMGFSIRWRLINCADYGLPQRRCRIFIMASCPGEPLPQFPKPTHSADPTPGLKPYTTVNSTISEIPISASHHSPSMALARSSSPWNGDALARCITTTGGHMIHPSGNRDFTHREFACLQGFPLEHWFGEVAAKKQIGNAVPPIVAGAMLEAVRRALEKEDLSTLHDTKSA